MMKLMTVALPASLLLGGCGAAFWGNLVVLSITVGIFVGTLSLGRSTESTRNGGSPTSSAR